MAEEYLIWRPIIAGNVYYWELEKVYSLDDLLKINALLDVKEAIEAVQTQIEKD